jgi:hypothetical protein
MAKSRIRLFNQTRSAEDAAEGAAAKDRTRLLNQLSILFLVLTPLMLICYLLILFFPQSPINPLAPIRPLTAAEISPRPSTVPSLTPTPTHTPHATNTPTDTPTPMVTETLPAVNPVVLTATGPRPTQNSGTPTPTESPFNYTYELIYQRAQLYGTNWAGIAGLVLDKDLKHQANIDVRAWGDPPLGAEGQTIPSGTFVQYGASGWEFTLADKPAFGKWQVQLVDADGQPLSPVIEIEMNGDPRSNLAYIIFRQNH